MTASGLVLTPDEPGDRLYRFEAPELKELNPRLAAQSYRFLHKHPRVEHLEVVVITPTNGTSWVPPGYRDSFSCFWARCTGSAWKL